MIFSWPHAARPGPDLSPPPPPPWMAGSAETAEATALLSIEILVSDSFLLNCDETLLCALARTCTALERACSAEWVWENAARMCWPALAHSAAHIPAGGRRALFRRRALLPGWRRICPLLDASLETVDSRAEGWPSVLTAQLLRLLGLSLVRMDRSGPGTDLLGEAPPVVGGNRRVHTFSNLSAIGLSTEFEEVHRWRAALLDALISPSKTHAFFSRRPRSAVLPPRLVELAVWACSLAAELDSFYSGVSTEEFSPPQWLSRITKVLRGRSALQLISDVIAAPAMLQGQRHSLTKPDDSVKGPLCCGTGVASSTLASLGNDARTARPNLLWSSGLCGSVPPTSLATPGVSGADALQSVPGMQVNAAGMAASMAYLDADSAMARPGLCEALQVMHFSTASDCVRGESFPDSSSETGDGTRIGALDSTPLVSSADPICDDRERQLRAREAWDACDLPLAMEAIDSSLESLFLEGFNVSVPAGWRPSAIPRSHSWWWCPAPVGRHAQG